MATNSVADQDISGSGNFEQNMIEALQGYIGAVNNAIVVDGEGSSPLSNLQATAMSQGRKWLSYIYTHSIAGSRSSSSLSKGQVEYNEANSVVNNVEQQASNLTQKATNDVNNDSSQSQEALNMASTIINGVGFFNNLLSQAFPA
ncbi:MAG: hypothetical protein P0S95_02180 [Rhabdochlamydiaceae bacterium]|nr:hypothetical protein [Candidatus Amphrikana amoebophyrae]